MSPAAHPKQTHNYALGAVVRAARSAAGLTLNELSGRVGVTRSTLSRFERGERDVSAATLQRIAAEVAAELADSEVAS